MNKLLAVAGAILLAVQAFGATITGTLKYATNAVIGTNIVFIPLSTPVGSSGIVYEGTPVTNKTAIDGTFSLSLAPGKYRVWISTVPSQQTHIQVPDNASSYTLAELLTNSLTLSGSSSLFVLKNTGYATNLTVSNVVLIGTVTGNISATNAPALTDNFLMHGTTNVGLTAAKILTAGTNLVMWTNGNRLYIAGLSNAPGTGGGNLVTNDTQFGESVVLTIKKMANLTNIQAYLGDGSGRAITTFGDIFMDDGFHIYGDGFYLTNLNGAGTGFAAGTIPTNAMDAEAHALYIAGDSTTSNANVIYVSPNGNDSTAVRGKESLPFLTISNAIRILTNGDTLKIMPGWYTNKAVMHMGYGDAPYLLQNLTNISIDAWGANTYWPTGISQMVIKKCNGVNVKGLGFFNDKTYTPPTWMYNYISVAPGTWAALTIVNSEHVNIEGCRFSDQWDHSIVANGDCAGNVAGDNNTTNDINVSRCTFANGGWYWGTWPDGAAIVAGPGQKITDNYISETARGIEIYPIPDTVYAAEGRSMTVVGNHIYKTKGEAIMVIRLGGGTISGNTIDNPVGFVADASFDVGIRVEFCQNVLFTANSVRNKANSILFPGASPATAVTNCTFSENSLRHYGILIDGTALSGCRFSDNTFSDMAFGGIVGNNNWQGNEFSRNRFVNVGTNNSQSPIYYNSGAGTCSSNVFDGNTFSTIFVNTKPTVTIEAGGTVAGNIYGQNFMLPGYTIPWAAPAGGITNANISGGQGYFSGTVYATNGAMLLTSSTVGYLWTATNTAGLGTWSNAPTFTASATNALSAIWTNGVAVTSTATNLNFVAGSANLTIVGSNDPAGRVTMILDASAGTGDAGGTNSRQIGSAVLTNLTAIGITNVGSGTNISIRVLGGSNYIDTTGNLIHWGSASTSWVSTVAAAEALKVTNTANLSTWSGVATSWVSTVAASEALKTTNTANLATWSGVQTNWVSTIAAAEALKVTNTANLSTWSGVATSWVTTVASAVTNNTIARTNGTEFIRTNKLTSVDGNIVVRHDGSGGVTLSNAMASVPTGTNFNNFAFTNALGTNLYLSGNLSVAGTNSVGELEVGTLVLTNPLWSGYVTSATASTLAVWGADKRATNLANPSGTKILYYTNSLFEWHTAPAGGTGTPEGPSGSIQFAEGSSLAGTNRLRYDRTNDILYASNIVANSISTPTFNAATLNATALNATNITFGKSNWFPGHVWIETNLWVSNSIFVGGTNLYGGLVSGTNDAYTYTRSLTNQPVLVASNITQAATNDAYTYARGVTNNTIARTNGTEFIRTNKITSVDGDIVVHQDGTGGVILSNTVSASGGPAIVTNSIWVAAGAWTPGSNAPSAGLRTNANASVTDFYGFDDTGLETISTTWAPGKSFGGYFKCLIAWETATPLTEASNITWSVAVNPIALGENFGTFPANYVTNWSTPAAFSYTSNKVYWTTNMPQLLITNLTPNVVFDVRVNRETNYVNKLQGDAKFIGAMFYTTSTNWMGGYPSD